MHIRIDNDNNNEITIIYFDVNMTERSGGLITFRSFLTLLEKLEDWQVVLNMSNTRHIDNECTSVLYDAIADGFQVVCCNVPENISRFLGKNIKDFSVRRFPDERSALASFHRANR